MHPDEMTEQNETEGGSGASNGNLSAAKKGKNDEFYTQWVDIEREINAYLEFDPDVFRDKILLLPCDDPEWSHFTKFFALHFADYGLKKLISTSYAPESNLDGAFYTPTLFETQHPDYDETKSMEKGRVFTLTREDISGDGRIDIDDLRWEYLPDDGDFRGKSVTALRDESDFVITNPPFSLFRDFIKWIFAGGKKCSVIGNVNAITYKEVFPLIQGNELWLGPTITSGDREFRVPESYPLRAAGSRVDEDGNKFIQVKGVRWFTNIEHGRRHQPLKLMSMSDNRKFSKHEKIRDGGYPKYDNYDAIEVGYVDAIPSDFSEVMGVPITFLDKYNPDQFEILGATQRGCHELVPDTKKYDDYREMRQDGSPTGSSGGKTNENANLVMNDGRKNYFVNDAGHVVQSAYQRIFIRHRKQETEE